MAQRISRAKQRIKGPGAQFRLPAGDDERARRRRSVLHVLYLIFNEGYASSVGRDLHRAELSGEAIRLTRMVHRMLPGDGEVAGLLALMLLTDARRPARARADGELIPLAEQDRTLWDQRLIAEGVALISAAVATGALGEYQLQAVIAAIHDQAARVEDTDWRQILALYGLLERMTGNPMVALNRAIAAAMPCGRPDAAGGARRAAGRPLPARRRARSSLRDGRRHPRRRGALPRRGRPHDEHSGAALPDPAGRPARRAQRAPPGQPPS
jgi:predicted RNA polymerase sigma factor